MSDIFEPLIRAVQAAAARWAGDPTQQTLCDVADLIHPAMQPLSLGPRELPWGRYLIHADPQDRFNIQLDVFSSDYTGSCHAHGSWGAFWLLRGRLRVWDYALVEGRPTLSRYGLFGPGGFQCFSPPMSDWHKVGTPPGGPQTVSIHIYGPGFDMDVGETLGEDGRPRAYRRSAFKELALALPHFKRGEAADV